MNAVRRDIELEEGSVLDTTFFWVYEDLTPHDLGGYSAVAEIREERSDTSTLLARLATIDYPGATQGLITIDGPTGAVRLRMDSDEVEALKTNWPARRAHYDIKLFPSTLGNPEDNIRFVEGRVRFDFEVTQ